MASGLQELRRTWVEADRHHRTVVRNMTQWYQQELEKEKNRLHTAMMQRYGADFRQTASAVKTAFDDYLKVSDGKFPHAVEWTEPAAPGETKEEHEHGA